VTDIDASRPPVEVLNAILSKVVTLPFYKKFASEIV
jgi:hypothetical protein